MDHTIRASLIADKVIRYTVTRGLPLPDFEGCPSLEATITSLLEREQMTDTEAFEFTICSEHVDPTLDEEFALKRMGEIVRVARIRRGCPANRMNDAVSF